jgi:hypothetical protein
MMQERLLRRVGYDGPVTCLFRGKVERPPRMSRRVFQRHMDQLREVDIRELQALTGWLGC